MFFFGSAMIETLRGDRISGVTRTTWTKALGVIDHPKLINSNTEYDTIIVHTYSSVSFNRRPIYAYTVWHQLAVSTISGPAPFHPSRPVRDSTGRKGKMTLQKTRNSLTNQPTNQPNNQTTKQPNNQPTNQTTNQTNKRPTNQAIWILIPVYWIPRYSASIF